MIRRFRPTPLHRPFTMGDPVLVVDVYPPRPAVILDLCGPDMLAVRLGRTATDYRTDTVDYVSRRAVRHAWRP